VLLHLLLNGAYFAGELRHQAPITVGGRQVEQLARLMQARGQTLPTSDVLFQSRQLLHGALRHVWLVPETGRRRLLLQPGNALLLAGDVKDAP
jgi:hypothetical protein